MRPLSSEFINKLSGCITAKGLDHPRYAVVIPLVYDTEEPYLLIEVRAKGISQAGDPCFPGGRIEPGETPAQAASRELKEELDICVPPEEFLGQLPTVQTRLGSNSDVFVCCVSQEDAAHARISPAEVETLLRVSVSFFLSQPEAMTYTVCGHTIWGMTAGAIRHFCAAWRQAETSGCHMKCPDSTLS